MTTKIIIIDPNAKTADTVIHRRCTPGELRKFNQSQPEVRPLTEADEADLEEMFLEAGILKEISIN